MVWVEFVTISVNILPSHIKVNNSKGIGDHGAQSSKTGGEYGNFFFVCCLPKKRSDELYQLMTRNYLFVEKNQATEKVAVHFRIVKSLLDLLVKTNTCNVND